MRKFKPLLQAKTEDVPNSSTGWKTTTLPLRYLNLLFNPMIHLFCRPENLIPPFSGLEKLSIPDALKYPD